MNRITPPLILKMIPIVCVVIAIKCVAHLPGWEILTLNPLLSSIIGLERPI